MELTIDSFNASILIHLDFLSIFETIEKMNNVVDGFNPYSPGFSIYLIEIDTLDFCIYSFNPYSPGFSIYFAAKGRDDLLVPGLQSLFTWIFYLFNRGDRMIFLYNPSGISK